MLHRVIFFSFVTISILTSPALAGNKKAIIGFRHGVGLAESDKHEKVQRTGGRIFRDHRSINAVSAELSDESICSLKNDPQVAYVEADKVIAVVEPVTVASATDQELLDSWGVKRIGADVAATKGITGAGIKVAILDTGIDPDHPDLKDNYKGGYNFVYDNNDPYDDSRYGHGTHLAGIIAARDNGTGVVGVAPEASLYALKVLNGGLMGSTSDILAGIEWAITNKMQVINMSFGAQMDSQAFRDACDAAFKAGIVLVAAAGNFNQPIVDNPAGFDPVIAVSATAQDGTKAAFSNYGAKVELSAPGVAVMSTVPGGGFGLMSGTSQATPHVSGVAALIFSAGIKDENGDGNLADEVRQRLAATATDLGDPGRDVYFGYGLVNADKAADIVQPQQYTVTRTGDNRGNGALNVVLKPGTYTIGISNNGLKNIIMGTSGDNSDTCYLLSQTTGGASSGHGNDEIIASFSFGPAQPQTVSSALKVEAECIVGFYPHGRVGTSAAITIAAH
ncbi:S8 family peptidase [Geomobilimonas luticola]|uniref:S8 family peptidase n=1 Tax=Geomobilimonas luticola TaxID=1114878 RepID=A0ABS5SFK8_9BACT|nr:S8 family peptidase [Geomobilimonas luticola]MBT0653990.1 S8 family peptidase [Geomobilimonas luticola]